MFRNFSDNDQLRLLLHFRFGHTEKATASLEAMALFSSPCAIWVSKSGHVALRPGFFDFGLVVFKTSCFDCSAHALHEALIIGQIVP